MNVPAGTKIRLEFANINNPLQVSASYTVTVTTRDATNAIIDGPSASAAYTIKKIGKNTIADGAITTEKIADDAILPQVLTRSGTSVSVSPNTFENGAAFCVSGEGPVGGGVFVFSPGAGFLTITNEFVSSSAGSYTVEMFNSHETNSFTFTPRAHCMAPFP